MKDFPYDAFALTPSFQLRPVTIIGFRCGGRYLIDATGGRYHHTDVHPTIKQAVAAGLEKVKANREAIKKRRKENDLRYANLCRIENKSREDGTWLANNSK